MANPCFMQMIKRACYVQPTKKKESLCYSFPIHHGKNIADQIWTRVWMKKLQTTNFYNLFFNFHRLSSSTTNSLNVSCVLSTSNLFYTTIFQFAWGRTFHENVTLFPLNISSRKNRNWKWIWVRLINQTLF